MALTDTFIKHVKPARAAGDKHADGDGMYLLVTPTGKGASRGSEQAEGQCLHLDPGSTKPRRPRVQHSSAVSRAC